MPTSVNLRPHDRVRLFASGATAPGGVDLATTIPGVHVVFRSGSAIVCRSTFTSGPPWSETAVANDAPDDAIPTICADANDDLFLAYHDGSDATVIGRSTDWGRTFTAWENAGTLKFPRLLLVTEPGTGKPPRQYLAGWVGGNVVVKRSSDWFVTLSTVLSFAADEQLVDLGLDRRGRVYVAYTSGGGTLQRTTEDDGENWAAPATLVAGRDRPALAHTTPSGLLLSWNGTVLYAERTTADYDSLEGSPVIVAPGLPRQHVGLAFDRREDAWLAGLVSGTTLKICWSNEWGGGGWEEI